MATSAAAIDTAWGRIRRTSAEVTILKKKAFKWNGRSKYADDHKIMCDYMKAVAAHNMAHRDYVAIATKYVKLTF